MKVAVAASLMIFGVLSGCAIPPVSRVEEAPEGVPRARLRVIIDADNPKARFNKYLGYTRGYPGSFCYRDWNQRDGELPGSGYMTTRSGSENTWNNRSLEMPEPERIAERLFGEIYVEAGQPFILRYSVSGGRYVYCDMAAGFIPRKDADYEMWVRADWELKKCGISMSVRTEEGMWIPAPMIRAPKCERR